MKNLITRMGRGIRHEALRMTAIGCILVFAVLPLLTLAFQISGRACWVRCGQGLMGIQGVGPEAAMASPLKSMT